MTSAVASVKGGMGLRTAARQYNVPVETLRRRVIGIVDMDCKPGPSTVLTASEEEKLSSYVVTMSDMGFGLSREDVQVMAFRLVELSGRRHPFSNGMAGRAWMDGFLHRHPRLTLRTPQALSYNRAFNATKEVIDDYFGKLGAICARLNILSKPMQIYNIDEVGVSIVHKPGKVITELGRRCVWSVTSAEKGKNHTILACVSASGFVLPPFMIYPRKRVTENIKENAFPGTNFNCSDSGWVNADLYLEWFKFFLSSIPPARPVLLIEDGHASHISIEVIELARENAVYLLCLPSHTTHILQPLDVGVFKSLKSHYSRECRKYLMDHPGQVITPHNIASLIGKAWPLALTPVNIMAGFKKGGAFPLNPGVVADRQVAPSLAVNPSCNVTSTDTSLNLSDPPESPCVSEKSSSLQSNAQFSPDKVQLYQKRYKEGYDLPDLEYQQWLEFYHPAGDDSTSSKVTHASGGKRAVSSCSESGSDVLSEVLKLPEPKPSSRRRRKGINSMAVHITDSGFLNDLKEKDEEKKAKETEKQAKKEERERKRVEREKNKAERAKKKAERERERMDHKQRKAECKEAAAEGKKGRKGKDQSMQAEMQRLFLANECSSDLESSSESSAESDAECPGCGLTYLDDDTHSVWVSCDVCGVWRDFKCTGLKNPNRVPKKYVCPDCKQ